MSKKKKAVTTEHYILFNMYGKQVLYNKIFVGSHNTYHTAIYLRFCMSTGVYILQNTMTKGGVEKNCAGKKMKNEAVRNKMKKKEKGKKKKGKGKGKRKGGE